MNTKVIQAYNCATACTRMGMLKAIPAHLYPRPTYPTTSERQLKLMGVKTSPPNPYTPGKLNTALQSAKL